MRGLKILIPLLAIVLCIGNISLVQAGSVEDGITWLNANQNADGCWGGEAAAITPPYHSTAVVAETYQYLGIADGNLTSAIMWLSAHDTPTVDHLSRQIEVLARAGIDVTGQVNALLSITSSEG